MILQTAGRCETSEIELSAEPSAAPVRDRDAPGGVRGEPVGSQSRSHGCVGDPLLVREEDPYACPVRTSRPTSQPSGASATR